MLKMEGYLINRSELGTFLKYLEMDSWSCKGQIVQIIE